MKNKAEALAALENDCELAGEYCLDGKTCALGRLAILSGVKPEAFEKCNEHTIGHHTLDKVRKAIHVKFGLDYFEMQRLQMTNDEYEDRQLRIQEVTAYIKSLPD